MSVTHDHHHPVLIIGAGLAGLTVALHLADRQPRLGHHPAHPVGRADLRGDRHGRSPGRNRGRSGCLDDRQRHQLSRQLPLVGDATCQHRGQAVL